MMPEETDTIHVPDTDTTISVEHSSDFISIYRNVFPEGYSQHMIENFERIKQNGVGWSREHPRHKVDDYAVILLAGVHNFLPFENINPLEGFFKRLQICFNNYCTRYSFLKELSITCSSVKMQRTDPTQGYHIYHSETGNQHNYLMYQNRAVVFTHYLNTLDLPGEGGETEYLYQKRRIPPVENTLVLWPATYTHLHRGNAVLGNRSKYILTGWFYYDAE